MRRLALAALVAAFVAAGCIESDQQITVMPDGSGKLVWKVGIRIGEKMEMKPEDVKSNLKDMEDGSDGIAAWVVDGPKAEDGWMRFTMTGYFEDVSKVKIYQGDGSGGEKKTQLAFALERTEQGTTLTLVDQLAEDMAKQPDAPEGETEEAKKAADNMKKTMKEMFKGFRMSVAIEAPGPITGSKGWTESKGSRAALVLDEQLMMDSIDQKPEAMEKLKSLQGPRTVTWQKDDLPAGKVEAFRKEMAEAKAAWEKAKSEAK